MYSVSGVRGWEPRCATGPLRRPDSPMSELPIPTSTTSTASRPSKSPPGPPLASIRRRRRLPGGRWRSSSPGLPRCSGSPFLPGASQGFDDLGGLSAEAVTAINQIKQLGITTGTTATTFDPNGVVNRWQMALFLTRLHPAGRWRPPGRGRSRVHRSGRPVAGSRHCRQSARGTGHHPRHRPRLVFTFEPGRPGANGVVPGAVDPDLSQNSPDGAETR